MTRTLATVARVFSMAVTPTRASDRQRRQSGTVVDGMSKTMRRGECASERDAGGVDQRRHLM
jgi:hypothetical protein